MEPREPPAASSPVPSALATAALAAVVALGALFTLRRFNDVDVLWHVRSGAWILEHGSVPRGDPFGSVTAGRAWLDVAWGWQLPAALLASAGGLAALQIATALVVVLGICRAVARAPRTPLVLLASLLFVLVGWQRFLVRPDLLSFPLTILLLELDDALRRGRRAALAGLVLLVAAWANLHGSFVLAPLVVAAGAAGAAMVGAWRELRLRLPALLLVLAAPVANPYGTAIYGLFGPYVASLRSATGLGPAGAGLDIAEWTPLWTAIRGGVPLPLGPLLLLFLLLVSSFAAAGRCAGRRAVGSRAAACAALLALSLTALRHGLPYAAAALFAIARNERERREGGQSPWLLQAFDGPRLGGAFSAGLLLATLSYLGATATDDYYVGENLPHRTGLLFHEELTPAGGIRWLAEHEAPAPLFNNFNMGSYLLYWLAPEVETFVDPRVVDAAHQLEVQRALATPEGFSALLTERGIRTIVLAHPSPETFTLLPWLQQSGTWRLLYRDDTATIHGLASAGEAVRRKAPLPLRPFSEPFADASNRALAPLVRRVVPVRELNEAVMAGALGERAAEWDAYRRALERAPYNRFAMRFLIEHPRPPAP